jgi:hypothetical protein
VNVANLTVPVNACLRQPVPWPVSGHRVFPGEASQVGEARRFSNSQLPGGSFTVRAGRDAGGWLRVEVTDQGGL